MQAIYRRDAHAATLLYAEVEPACQQAIQGLYYLPAEGGLAKRFPPDTPDMDRIGAQFERHGVAMARQAADQVPVPWEAALLAFLQAVEGQGVDWWLVGSAALAVRGVAITPHDLDLDTDGAGARRLGALLGPHLVEPVLPSGGWIADWFGRAFFHARIEWVGDVHADVDAQGVSDFGPTARARSELVTWRGHQIRVPPVDLQLAITRQRGLSHRVAQIEAWQREDA